MVLFNLPWYIVSVPWLAHSQCTGYVRKNRSPFYHYFSLCRPSCKYVNKKFRIPMQWFQAKCGNLFAKIVSCECSEVYNVRNNLMKTGACILKAKIRLWKLTIARIMYLAMLSWQHEYFLQDCLVIQKSKPSNDNKLLSVLLL